jgi:hypothetical protein
MNDHGPLTHLLGQLSDAAPDPVRSARVQARCRTVLARKTAPAPPPARRVESLCVAGFCVVYLITVIQYALQ